MKNGRGNRWEIDDRRRRRIESMLKDDQPVSQIARSLGVSETTLRERLTELGIEVPSRVVMYD